MLKNNTVWLTTATFVLGLVLGCFVSTNLNAVDKAGKTIITLKLGDKNAVVDSIKKTMEQPPMLVKGVVMVPLKFMTNSIGASLNWDSKKGTGIIVHGKSDVFLSGQAKPQREIIKSDMFDIGENTSPNAPVSTSISWTLMAPRLGDTKFAIKVIKSDGTVCDTIDDPHLENNKDSGFSTNRLMKGKYRIEVTTQDTGLYGYLWTVILKEGIR